MSPDLRIAAVAARQHGVFHRQQALDAGFTKAMVRGRVEQGRWGRMHPNVFRLAGSPSSWDQVMFAAWLAAGHGAVVSHCAAGHLWDLPDMPDRLELTVPEARRVAVRGARVHRASRLDTVDLGRRHGLPVTAVPRTLIDLAGCLRPRLVENALDHCLTRHLTTPREVRARLRALGRPGRKGASLMAALLDERPQHFVPPESELERRLLRLLSRLPGPPPVPQLELRLPSGRLVRIDIAYPEAMVAVEADSYVHHASRAAWSKDRARNNELMAAGWRVIPVTWDDVAHRSEWVLETVGRARATGVRKEVAP